MRRSDLHTYQQRAVEFIGDQQRCALMLDMGLGKTCSALTAASDLMEAGVIKRCLVIAPLRVANSVWKQEADKWEHLSHLRVNITTGSAASRLKALKAPADIYVINRENVVWLLKECKGKWPFDMVIIDESSSFKNNRAKRFLALKKVIHIPTIVVLLTGTPSPNGLMDLWSQMYLLDPNVLGKTITGYRQRFFTQDYWGHSWEPQLGSDKKIQKLIAPMCMSMMGKDYLELPERIDIVERLDLPARVMEDYEELEDELFLELPDGDIEALSAAVLAGKLLQFANGAVYTDDKGDWTDIHGTKLDALQEIIDENPNENIICAYNYKHDLMRLRDRFPGAQVLDRAGSQVDAWNRGEIKLLLCHPASAGHGLNLQQGGSMIVWFGLNWALELDQQMNARLHRQGQKRPVRVVRLVARGTIDERVLGVLKNKDAVQSDLLKALRR